MRVYVDSSALIKRSVEEAESPDLVATLEGYIAAEAAVVSSALAWVEVSRGLRALLDERVGEDAISAAIDAALSGIAERPIGADVVGLARRCAPPTLRTLDAIHLATAILLDADAVVAYDERLLAAYRHNGLATVTPGR